jgi:hypothetical protein
MAMEIVSLGMRVEDGGVALALASLTSVYDYRKSADVHPHDRFPLATSILMIAATSEVRSENSRNKLQATGKSPCEHRARPVLPRESRHTLP